MFASINQSPECECLNLLWALETYCILRPGTSYNNNNRTGHVKVCQTLLFPLPSVIPPLAKLPYDCMTALPPRLFLLHACLRMLTANDSLAEVDRGHDGSAEKWLLFKRSAGEIRSGGCTRNNGC